MLGNLVLAGRWFIHEVELQARVPSASPEALWPLSGQVVSSFWLSGDVAFPLSYSYVEEIGDGMARTAWHCLSTVRDTRATFPGLRELRTEIRFRVWFGLNFLVPSNSATLDTRTEAAEKEGV